MYPTAGTIFHRSRTSLQLWFAAIELARGEGANFYPPMLQDLVVSGRRFAGTTHVWRTDDNGGDRTFLKDHCNAVFGDELFSGNCGDWQEPGKHGLEESFYGSDKLADVSTNNYIVRLSRSMDQSTLWAGLRRGRVFISKNADASPGSVTFYRIDTSDQPERFVSGIYVDPNNPYVRHVLGLQRLRRRGGDGRRPRLLGHRRPEQLQRDDLLGDVDEPRLRHR